MEYLQQLLSLTNRPAFCVENGIIIAANHAAQARQILPDTPAAPLLASGAAVLSEFQQGFLSLNLSVLGQQIPATVSILDSRLLFTLEPEETETEFRLLSLASQELRDPLCDVMALVEELREDRELVAGINRGLHRMLRLIGNMTPHPTPRMELVEMNVRLEDLCEKVRPACESRGIRLLFTPHSRAIYSCVDETLLNRAIYNLLSNAIKYSGGDTIKLQLSAAEHSYRITIRDSGSRLPGLDQDPFSRFLREPGSGDPNWGMGLGMRLVRSAALAHGGTVLMDTPPEGGVRVTMTLPVRQDSSALRSPRLQVDYTGEHDPMLVELSDVLPTEFYK